MGRDGLIVYSVRITPRSTYLWSCRASRDPLLIEVLVLTMYRKEVGPLHSLHLQWDCKLSL